uniref:PUA domain-containing protein n=1 Tax=Lotharella globosa TaxID=91324 RepID=A0A7S4DTG6_9EUKA|mmetsp:Transcript_6471/g.11924  ORF Transcript_6471/g.11924 Transcript_6471/m.11924 type:complete len:408 (+) Transcript_6471:51-1274(+)
MSASDGKRTLPRERSMTDDTKPTIVIKVGTSSLVDASTGLPSLSKIAALVEVLCKLKRNDMNVALVSSGAVGFGCLALGLKERPEGVMVKQALAATGQAKLMELYGRMFNSLGESCAQVLLTYDNLGHRAQFLNAVNTFEALFKLGVVPVVNENDTVAVEELRFGDNDCLSAMVASMLKAERLIILTDVDGLYTSNPNKDPDAKRIPVVDNIDDLDVDTSSAGSALGTGGMATKITAAKLATASGVDMSIVSAKNPTIILEVMRGDNVGTLFKKRSLKVSKDRKRWIAGLPARQSIYLDDGAVRAIKEKKSLYAAGIIKINGKFPSNVAIGLADSKGVVFAQGITNYSSAELALLKGKQMQETFDCLGYHGSEHVMHRGNIVLLEFAGKKYLQQQEEDEDAKEKTES